MDVHIRITELIRANSREVIRRRALNAQAEIMKKHLQAILAVSTIQEAQVIAQMALGRAARVNPADYGRP